MATGNLVIRPQSDAGLVTLRFKRCRSVIFGVRGSIDWLRANLRRIGRDLRPGEIVSTGSMTRVPKIASGERCTIEALRGELQTLTIDVD